MALAAITVVDGFCMGFFLSLEVFQRGALDSQGKRIFQSCLGSLGVGERDRTVYDMIPVSYLWNFGRRII